MDTLSKFLFPSILFWATLAFGFWLSHYGKPYHGLLFNLHKLLALSAVILIVLQASKLPWPAVSPVLIAGFLAVAALSVIALFVSGALMSAGKLDYAMMLATHRIALLLLVSALGAVVYLLEKTP